LGIILALSISHQAFSQELNQFHLDSLYNKFIQLRAPELLPETEQHVELISADTKCGLGLVNELKLNIDRFSAEQQNHLKKILIRPTKQTSIVSPSGFFRIHYDTTGNQAPKYNPALTPAENAWQAALAADSAYNFEVNFLGYPPPPNDFGEGGDNRYDIYISGADGNYGFTESEVPLGNQKFTSHIQIHYEFQSNAFYTKGLSAMRATVAHELHHAIQIGNYIFRLDDLFFYELTSTSMEEFVFDDVNDYYFYISNYTNNPARVFTRFNYINPDGYDLAIWNIYLQKNFDFDIIKRQWELMPTQRAILAIGNSILERGSTFAREYNKFGLWTYYTGYRAIPNRYFEEAQFYPVVKPLTKIPFNNSYPPIVVEAQLTSNNYIQFNINPGGDTLFAVITNGNLSSAVSSPGQSSNFKYTLYANASSGERKLTENFSSDFEAADPGWWSVSEILNGLIVREDSAVIPGVNVVESFVFPNPFRYNGNISVSIEGKQGEDLSFNVYSSDMSLVYSVQKPANILLNNTIGISWDGFDNNGNSLGSGVYIYVIKLGDEVIKGKVVIFNE
jgi:hypothetical protein